VELALGGAHHHHHQHGRGEKKRSTRTDRGRARTTTEEEESTDDGLPAACAATLCVCDSGDVVDNIYSLNERERIRQELVELEQMAREIGIDTWDDYDIPMEETNTTHELVDPELPSSPRSHDHVHAEEKECAQPKERARSKERAWSKDRAQSKEQRSKSKDRVKERAKRREREMEKKQVDLEKKQLEKMGLNTAFAIAMHNFPEGLATFVSTLSDPKVGFVLAVAIALHNIPEGLCVALPIYYATHSRWKAFGWALLSGLSEPLAALLGWLVLVNIFSPTVFAILYGMVAGMMVMISVRELLPTALRYDPDNTYVTMGFVAGMLLMALSLVLGAL
jgi:zinc transporter ZupT